MNSHSTAKQVSPPDDDETSPSAPLDDGQPEALPDAVDPLSSDEPLSQAFGGEQIVLLAQSPETLFLYWHHATDPHSTLRKALGEAAASYRLAVRLVDDASGEEILQDASDTGTLWFDVKPGRAYRADVGFVGDGRPFVRVMSSAVVQTPRKGVSQIIDDVHEFQLTAPEFASVLKEAGYAADALEISLEAANAQTGDRTTLRSRAENPSPVRRPPPSPSSFTMLRSAGLEPI